MATGKNKARVENAVVDKSPGRQLRIMEHTIFYILDPEIAKAKRNKNWQPYASLFAGITLSLANFKYSEILKLGDNNVFNGINWLKLFVLVVYICLLVYAIWMLCDYFKHRKEQEVTTQGLVDLLMSQNSQGSIMDGVSNDNGEE